MDQNVNAQLAAAEGEGRMAKADLYRAAKHSMKLFQMIQDGQQLEGWVQAKITKAADYLDSIYHYMEYQVKFGGGNVAASVDDITGDMSAPKAEPEEKEEVEESMNYEQKLQALLEGAKKKAKPDYIDADNDGNKKEPMKKALKDKEVKEGWDDMIKASKEKKGTGKFDKKEVKPGVTQYTRKASTFSDGGDDADTKKAKKKAKATSEGIGDVAKKVGGAVKAGAKAVGKAIVGKDDDELLADLKKKAGVKNPGNGKPSMAQSNESTGDYSAKKARAGKDIGKPGKNFEKIADKAGKAYGSKERGKKVAGAVLAKLRKG